jgi:hypothetical protein
MRIVAWEKVYDKFGNSGATRLLKWSNSREINVVMMAFTTLTYDTLSSISDALHDLLASQRYVKVDCTTATYDTHKKSHNKHYITIKKVVNR